MKVIARGFIFSIWLIFLSNPLFSQDKNGLFGDSLDNAFDISNWLFELHGILPIISPITEPALGYGFIGAPVPGIQVLVSDT